MDPSETTDMEEKTQEIDTDSVAHKILVLLLDAHPKDLIRMSVLSKTWFAITASFPILNFDLGEFYKLIHPKIPFDKREEDCYVRRSFFKYVEYTTSRFCRQKASTAHCFKIITNFKNRYEVDITDRCLESVFKKGVQVFEIYIKNGQYLPPSVPEYCVPKNISTASSSLKSLTVCGCQLPLSLMVDIVKLEHLKQLHLEYVLLDESFIKFFTTSCPRIVDFYVKFCSGLKRFEISGLRNLEEVQFAYEEGVERIDIDAPNLSFLHLMCPAEGNAAYVNVASCKKLKTLYHCGHLTPAGTELIDLSSNYPVLETLILDLPNTSKSLKLSSKSLKTFLLYAEYDLEKLDLYTPNLLLFDYKSHSYRLPFVKRNIFPSKACMDYYPDDVDSLWFQKLRQFLDKEVKFKELMLNINLKVIR